jgi:rhodanese-related sulfurtransferase
MKTITRDELKEMIDRDEDVSIVETLDEKYFRKFHLPGAINVPPGEEFDERIQEAVPDKDQPVVVYCLDAECDASPRAARTMEELGYTNVMDYAAGKMDWKDADLPIENSH